MEPLLLLVTIVSLALGVVMSLVAWKLLRHARVQSAARIEALQAMSAEPAEDDEDVPATPRARVAVPDPAADLPRDAVSAARFATLDDDDLPIERATPQETAPPAEPARTAEAEPAWDAIRDRPAARSAQAPRRAREIHVRFAATDEPRAPGRRWAALSAVAAVMVAGFASVYAFYSTDAAGAFGRLITASASPATADPLQLLSLKHVTDETGTFVLTGLVQNPASGQPRRGVVAVVYLFDQQGRYFAGGRTPLELTTFHPGEESPFVVRVSGAQDVARYRVGFRMDDGGVVAHVDRRGQLPGGTVEDATDDGERVLPLPGRSEG
jgi:hypothetical protein